MNTPNKDKKEWRNLLQGDSDIPIKNFFLQMKVSQMKKLLEQGKVSIDDAVEDLYDLCNNITDVKHVSEDLEVISHISDDQEPDISIEKTENTKTENIVTESKTEETKTEKEIDLISLDSSDHIRPIEEENKEFISSQEKKEELERFLAEKQHEEKKLKERRQAKVALQLKQEKEAKLAQEKKLNADKLIQEQFEQQREDWIKVNQESVMKKEIDFFKYNNENPLDSEVKKDEGKKPKKGFFRSLFSSDKSDEAEESDQ